MDADPDKLGKIAGVSAEIGFTRLSLTTDELKLFEYLNFDQKQIPTGVLQTARRLLRSKHEPLRLLIKQLT